MAISAVPGSGIRRRMPKRKVWADIQKALNLKLRRA
jgi:hypothetical protein